MILLIVIAQTLENCNRIPERRFRHDDRLQAALQGGVFFNVLAVFFQRGGADQAHFAAGQGRFHNISRVHGAFRPAGANQQMQLVNKDDGSLVFDDFSHSFFEPFFELAAIFRTGQH